MRKLVIGNKNYSTWSFRAWWVLKQTGLPFEEVRVPLYADGHREKLQAYAPTGMAPVLIEDDFAIWDSLAICEYLAEAHSALWPKDTKARARARSLSAEMHSGFQGIRGTLHMNCRAENRSVPIAHEVEAEIRRVESIIEECRHANRDAGPWLFGDFSIADAMFAPLLFSMATYQVKNGDVVNAYHQTVMQDASVRTWFAAAREESETITLCETGG